MRSLSATRSPAVRRPAVLLAATTLAVTVVACGGDPEPEIDDAGTETEDEQAEDEPDDAADDEDDDTSDDDGSDDEDRDDETAGDDGDEATGDDAAGDDAAGDDAAGDDDTSDAGSSDEGPEPDADEVDDPCAEHQGRAGEAFIDVVAPVDKQRVEAGELDLVGCSNVPEGNVSYRLLDTDGATLDDGFVTAECGTGCVGAFDEPIDLAAAEGNDEVTLEVFAEALTDEGGGGDQDITELTLIIDG